VARKVSAGGVTEDPLKLQMRTATTPAELTRIIPRTPWGMEGGQPGATESPLLAPVKPMVSSDLHAQVEIVGNVRLAVAVK
jgi:hypothetical protein